MGELVISERPTNEEVVIADSFVRVEDKYLVPQTLKTDLLNLIARYLTPAYVDSATKFTLVESIYFDSEKLDLFQHHFSNMEQRFKLRVRRYAPNGRWENGPSFLEAKCKVKQTTGQSISSKKRFRIDSENLNLLLAGQEIIVTNILEALNQRMGIIELMERVNFVNSMVKTYKLNPQVRVRYERLAFESGDLRVTFDKNVQFEELHAIDRSAADLIKHHDLWTSATGMRKIFSNDEYMVMEVKHSELVPLWLTEFLFRNHFSKVSFSKYCWGMTNLIDRVEDIWS